MNRSSSVVLHGCWIAAMCWSVNCRAETISVRVVDASGQPLPDAVISIDGLPQGPAASGSTLDQRDLRFVPRVLAVREGGSVRFINSDKVNHHVYSFSPVQRFDLRLKRGEKGDSKNFEKAGTVVIGCNIHDWMLGFIRVVDSDYFAVTDAKGESVIDVPKPWPEGAILRVWHPRIAENEGELLGKLAPRVVMAAAKALKPDPWATMPDYR